MKNFQLFFLGLYLFSMPGELFSQEQTSQPVSSVKGIKYLQEYFQQTSENLEHETSGLSSAQLQFKPSEEQWSVSQCLEHIIKTEKMLFGMVTEIMSKPANPERSSEVNNTDDQIISGIESRSNKFKAPAELEPVGMYKDSETAMKDLREQRKQILDYLATVSSEDLRNHISESPFGPINAYQSMLYIPGHTARHTHQIKEVKSSPAFPQE